MRKKRFIIAGKGERPTTFRIIGIMASTLLLLLVTVLHMGMIENSWLISGNSTTDTIVIDAGHGGFDGGAVSKDGTMEKDINLAIAHKLRELAERDGWRVVMTRTEDTALDERNPEKKQIRTRKTEDLRNRKKLIDETDPVLAISIHLNSFQEDPGVRGAQTFYPTAAADELIVEESKRLAECVQKELVEGIDDGTKREALGKKDVLLLKDPKVPTILVECGFLSNSSDVENLKKEEFQAKLSEFIYNGIWAFSGKKRDENLFVLDSFQ